MYCITIVLTVLAFIVTAEESDHCHANDDNPYLYFGTKSAYNFMHGELKPQESEYNFYRCLKLYTIYLFYY